VNARQYEQMLANRRARGPLRLADAHPRAKNQVSPIAGIVGKAARILRQRQAGAGAWERLARPAWLADTEVDEIAGDTLVVLVSGAALLFELRRQRAALERQLARLVPGVRRLRFAPAGAPPEMETE
jgi:hypothetical protein